MSENASYAVYQALFQKVIGSSIDDSEIVQSVVYKRNIACNVNTKPMMCETTADDMIQSYTDDFRAITVLKS